VGRARRAPGGPGSHDARAIRTGVSKP